MLPVLRLLATDRLEMQPHIYREAAPSCFRDLERRIFACSEWILVRVEDFELDFVEPGCKGGVAFGLADVDGPALGVVVGDAFWARGVAERWEVEGLGSYDCMGSEAGMKMGS
jgi:hypothetical protein